MLNFASFLESQTGVIIGGGDVRPAFFLLQGFFIIF
jgi:hypothetical protein